MGKQRRNDRILEFVAERLSRSWNSTSHLMKDSRHHSPILLLLSACKALQSSNDGEVIIFTSVGLCWAEIYLYFSWYYFYLLDKQREVYFSIQFFRYLQIAITFFIYSFSYSLEFTVTLLWHSLVHQCCSKAATRSETKGFSNFNLSLLDNIQCLLSRCGSISSLKFV